MPSAIAAAIDQVVREHMAPVLSERGFRRKGRTFYREMAPGLLHALEVRGNKWNRGDEGSFDLTMWVEVIEVSEVVLQREAPGGRPLGYAVHAADPSKFLGRADQWWPIDAHHTPESAGLDVVTGLERVLNPYFEGFATRQLVEAYLRDQANRSRWRSGLHALAIMLDRRGAHHEARAALEECIAHAANEAVKDQLIRRGVRFPP